MSADPVSVRTPPAALARVLPFALFIGVLALRSLLPDGAPARWLYAVQALLPLIALAYFWRSYDELRESPGGRRVAEAAVAVGAGLAIFVVWISATQPWMRLGEPATRYVPEAGDGTLDWALIALRIASASLVVPLMEELFWRSFLMRWLDDRDFTRRDPGTVSLFAIFGSAAAFALAHDLWLAGFVAGVGFALLYRVTGNLWVAIGAHAVANFALGAWVVTQRQWAFW